MITNAPLPPPAWSSLAHPRRGGPVASRAEADAGAVPVVDEIVRGAEAMIEELLGHPEADAGIVADVRAWLRGEENPRGAAAVAVTAVRRMEVVDEGARAAFVDAWAVQHGLPFAACAFVELCGVYTGGYGKKTQWVLQDADGDYYLDWWWGGAVMRRMRSLLAAADDAVYQESVERLAAHRARPKRRMAVSYLVPTETKWVDECIAERGSPRGEAVADAQLFCSLTEPRQLDEQRLRDAVRYRGLTPEVLATLVYELGSAAAPLVEAALCNNKEAMRRELVARLAELPYEETCRLLVERIEWPQCWDVLRTVAAGHPEMVVRLLVPAAATGDTAARFADSLLRELLSAHPELVAALPPELAGIVAPSVPDAEDLPELLAKPPWTRRRAKSRPVALDGPPPLPEPAMVWLEGEREDWDGRTRYLPKWTTQSPVDWAAAERWESSPYRSGPEYWLWTLVARHDLQALPVATWVASRFPVSVGEALLPYLAPEVARMMADWIARLKTGRSIARRWVRRHGLTAVPLLLPLAFGDAGPERRGAEEALRLIASEHGADLVVKAAGDAGAAVGALLAADPLEVLPARIPNTAWADPARLPPVLTRGRDRKLPPEATRHLLTMLAMSKPEAPYPGLDVVRGLCDPASLAEFSWALFTDWYTLGGAGKDRWAFLQLGWLGDDTTVRRLVPLIRLWPAGRATARAVAGLDVLGEIGSDAALTNLHALARKGSFKGLKARAQQKIDDIAAARGLTVDELADRAVPDFGLAEDGGLTFDYGPRAFRAGFDERLQPFVVEESGKRRTDLPKPGTADDPALAPAAYARFAELKKELRSVTDGEIERLEAAMVHRRRWTPEDFRAVLVEHPLLWHLARRLVWLAEDGGTTVAFRVAEDRGYADVNDEAFQPSAASRIGVAHPVLLGEALPAWSELFADYEILQPFPQLGRPVHTLTEQERTATRLERLEGLKAPYGKLMGYARSRWRATGEDHRWVARADPAGRHVVVNLSPGLDAYYQGGDDQTYQAVWAGHAPGEVPEAGGSLPLGDIDPVTMSEAIHDLTRIAL
ncbi:DUF4132 domain-containing protein [Spirillospora sp. NPDC127200]